MDTAAPRFAAVALITCLLAVALTPLFADSPDLLAQEMTRQTASAPWGQVYRKRPGCSPFVAAGNTSIKAMGQWSFACTWTLRGIQRNEYYYATPIGTVTLQYVHLSLPSTPAPANALFLAIEQRLQRAYGQPFRPFGLLPTGAWQHTPERAGQRWSIAPSEIILHQQPHTPLYGEIISGPQVAVIERRRFKLIEGDEELEREIGLEQYFRSAHLGHDRVRREFPEYAGLLERTKYPILDRVRRELATRRAALRLLKQVKLANPERKALLLVTADELVDRLADLLVDNRGEVPEAPIARRQLKPFGVTLGTPMWDGGLSYNMSLLRRAAAEVPNSEWGEIAFVRMLARGLDWKGFFGCQPVDQFGMVADKGEAYLAAHPDTARRKELLFTLALAYETWWSASNAKPTDSLTYEQFGPMRDRYLPRADAARQKAIRCYEEVIRLAADSPEARMAGRQLPRLKLNLDTGQRAFLCTNC